MPKSAPTSTKAPPAPKETSSSSAPTQQPDSKQARAFLLKPRNTSAYWLGRWHQWQSLRKKAKSTRQLIPSK